jgi:hypothetical protein
MSAPECDPLLASEVARQKTIAIESDARCGRMFVVCSIASVVLGVVGAWFLFLREPNDREWGAACAMIFGAWFIGVCAMLQLCLTRSATKCPKCGIAWEEEGCVWPTWKHCPGCGLKMSDDTGSQEKP